MERESEPGRRVTLPLVRPAERTSRVLLVRPFHRPPVNYEREALILRMEGVGGLVSACLNGQEIVRPPSGTTEVSVRLDQPLPARNVLVLEVDLPALLDTSGDESLWGIIALVIQPFGA